LIIKKLKPGSQELQILKNLRHSSENIISLVSSIDNDLVVLPLYQPLVPPLAFGGIRKDRLIPFANDLCRGLGFLHSRKIAHLDVRPDNLVIDGEKLLLIDFSESVQGVDEVEGIFGTKGYQAPEITGKKFNPFKADVFSCGITLKQFSLLLGSRFGPHLDSLMNQFMAPDPDSRPSPEWWGEVQKPRLLLRSSDWLVGKDGAQVVSAFA
jgi:serine/threonine protein kinase